MARRHNSIRNVLLAGSMLAVWPVLAADVTPERLLNPDKEPQNWLMNHRTYDGQRFSPLDKINKANEMCIRDSLRPSDREQRASGTRVPKKSKAAHVELVHPAKSGDHRLTPILSAVKYPARVSSLVLQAFDSSKVEIYLPHSNPLNLLIRPKAPSRTTYTKELRHSEMFRSEH